MFDPTVPNREFHCPQAKKARNTCVARFVGGKEVGYLSRDGRENPDESLLPLLVEDEEDWAGAENDRLGVGVEKDRLGAGDGAGGENDLLGDGLEKDRGAGAACGSDGTLEGAWKLGYEGACLAGMEN